MVIKAFPAGDLRVSRAADFGADVILLDAANPGSGKVFDWALAGDLPEGQRLVIAGGLDAGNVATAVAKVKPWGVDVTSGVEASPGCEGPDESKGVRRGGQASRGRMWPRRTATLSQGSFDGPYDWAEDEYTIDVRTADGRARRDGRFGNFRRPLRPRSAGAGVPGPGA